MRRIHHVWPHRAFPWYTTRPPADVENSCCEFSAVVACPTHPLARIHRSNAKTSPASEFARDVPRLTVTRGIEQKLLKPSRGSGRGLLVLQLGFEPIVRICAKIIRSRLHCTLPPHHLAHARNAGNSYREFCAVVLSHACRSHVHAMLRATHNCPSLCRRGHAFGSGSTVYSRGKGTFRLCWISRRHCPGIRLKQTRLKRT